jgi:hypothetical protein
LVGNGYGGQWISTLAVSRKYTWASWWGALLHGRGRMGDGKLMVKSAWMYPSIRLDKLR